MKVLRFIGAVALAIITSLIIRKLSMLLYSGTAAMIHDFDFLNLIIYIVVLGLVVGIFNRLCQLLLHGLLYTVNCSKFTAIIVIIVFVNYYVGDCLYFLEVSSWGYNSSKLYELAKEGFGDFYKTGAKILLLIELFCYASFSLPLFVKREN